MWSTAYSPPAGIPERHRAPGLGPRRNSCEARPGLIESTHIAPLNEGLMAEDHAPAHAAPKRKAPLEKRRNSCEARPGLIESTHIAPLNEGLMTEDHMAMKGEMRDMRDMRDTKDMKDMPQGAHGHSADVMDSFMRHSLR